jgi:pilus assembly protein Flp/PilA
MQRCPLTGARDWGQVMLRLWRTFVRDTRGATAVEYGLIVSLIIVGILVSVTFFADRSIQMWNMVSNRVISGR